MKGSYGTLLLASGLSVMTPNSFSRQLALLRRYLIESGFNVLFCGKSKTGTVPADAAAWSPEGPFDLPDFSEETVAGLVSRFGINRVILIGYPDQFPFIGGSPGIPVLFWYQSSRPKLIPELETVTVVPLTRMTAAHLKQSGLGQTGPVIPHGVDTRIFRPGAGVTKSGAGSPRLMSVGANSRRKRIDKLIEAFRLVVNHLPNAKLSIKTDASEKVGGFDITRLLDHYEVTDSVSVITAELPDSALAELYASSDFYIHTAEWEGFCIPVIEAMACGVPVVTHRVQGPGELVPYPDLLVPGSKAVHDGDVELLEADPVSFAEAVVRLSGEPSLSRQAAEAGRSAALSLYDIRVVARRWTSLLLET